MKRSALVFGCGKTACGLIGEITHRAKLHTTFIARKASMVNAIEQNSGYLLKHVGKKFTYSSIRDCSALLLNQYDEIADAVADAQVIFTAIGIENLSSIAPFLAAGLVRRRKVNAKQPLNIVVCEDNPEGAKFLQQKVESLIKPLHHAHKFYYFSSALGNRIMGHSEIEHGELCFTVDKHYSLIIDRSSLLIPFDNFTNVTLTDDFFAEYLQKLYTYDSARAIAAYHGYQQGCSFLHQAANHSLVEPVLEKTMQEIQSALIALYPQWMGNLIKYIKYSLARMKDSHLLNTIDEAAGDPWEILHPRGPLLGPLNLARRFHLPHKHLNRTVAAALAYDKQTDSRTNKLSLEIRRQGINAVLSNRCGFHQQDRTMQKIHREFLRLKRRIPPAPSPSPENRHNTIRTLFSF